MKPDEQKMVLADYTLVNSSSPDYNRYVNLYPQLAHEPIYVLKASMKITKKLATKLHEGTRRKKVEVKVEVEITKH
jgi:hypothetical protein